MDSWSAASLRGAWTALVTPMKDDALDEEALRRLVEAQIAGGIAGLVPCGTTGEAPTLTAAEHVRVVRATVEQSKGRAPVFAGCGTNSTASTIERCRAAREAGADGLMLVAPYYNKPTQAGLVAHFRAIVREVPLPTIVYNIPGRCAVDMSAATIVELAAAVPEVIGVKEATGNVLRTQEILELAPNRLAMMSGDDILTLPMLACGARGVVSVTSNVLPAAVAGVIDYWESGRPLAARTAHYALVPLHRALFVESNPGPVKAALAERGLIAPGIRLPMTWPSRATIDAVMAALAKVQRAREAEA